MKAIAVLRMLLPSREASPRAVAVNVTWYLAICLLLASLTFLPSHLDAGGSITEFTHVIGGAVTTTISPVFVAVAAIWLMYAYFFVLAAPLARPIGQGRTPTKALASAGEWVLQTAWRVISHWWAALRFFLAFPTPRFDVSLLRTHVRPGLAHVSSCWSAGTHPQVVYAPNLR